MSTKTYEERQRQHELLAPIIDEFLAYPQGGDTKDEWLHRVQRRLSFMRDPSTNEPSPSAVEAARQMVNDCKNRDGTLDEASVRETMTRLVSALYRADGRYPPLA